VVTSLTSCCELICISTGMCAQNVVIYMLGTYQLGTCLTGR
jgi:hypothetical protein